MGISFTQVLLGIISFGLGYYIKARFEINQEDTINELQMQIEKLKEEDEKIIQKQRYQLWEVEQASNFLKRDFLELKEKVKTGSFNSIKMEKEPENSKKNVLKSFL